MTNQVKFLLVPLALCLLAGCGNPEADTSGTEEAASLNPYADVRDVRSAAIAMYGRERVEWSESACQAMEQAGPGSQRAALREYGMTEASIDELFKGASEDDMYEAVVSYGTEDCGRFLLAHELVWQKNNS
jgi:hypothetical protein